jgi:O-antigen biosynthesis protein
LTIVPEYRWRVIDLGTRVAGTMMSRQRDFPKDIVRPIVFETPDRLTNVDSWQGHIPFAFWIVEALRPRLLVELGTYKGDSYCAFNQAIDRLGLSTACYAIDTWRGDEQTGFYGDEVFEDLRRYHDPRYGRFSRLIRSTFDDAAAHFTADSIDLLHIDGLHTYSAVKHDFETWRPKLSAGSVVLFHDINVLESDFGVGRLWNELTHDYPSFTFRHSHGLGVLAVGSDIARPVQRLASYNEVDSDRVRVFFTRLGSALSVYADASAKQTALLTLGTKLREMERQNGELNATLEQSKNRDDTYRQLAATESALNDRERNNAELNETLLRAEKARDEVYKQLATIETRLNDSERKNAELNDVLRQLKGARDESLGQLAAAEYRLSDIERQNAELAVLLRQNGNAREEAYGWVKAAESKLNDNEQKIAELTQRACCSDDMLQKTRDEIQQGLVNLKALKAENEMLKASVDRLRANNNSLRSENKKSEARAQSIAEANAILLSEINNLWTSRSWRLLRPVRNFVNRRRGLGREGETPPTLYSEWSELEAIKTIVTIRQSLSWELTAPLRLFHRFLAPHSRSAVAADAVAAASEAKVADLPPSDAWHAGSAVQDRNKSMIGDSVVERNQRKQSMRDFFSTRLAAFLASDGRLKLPQAGHPEVSIILVLYNQAPLTFGCFSSIAEGLGASSVGVEVIIVDNDSTDETADLLQHTENATVLSNGANVGFLKAVNQAASRARGRYILLLNNDAQLLPGTLEAAVCVLDSSPKVGAVGGRLILPDGTLQEAGSIVWDDGSCLGYGRGDSPTAPPYMFRRDVDYCSGAFLLTRLELFKRIGGFDEAFVPAYYEETDYCMRLWEAGFRIVYEPEAVVLHYEFGSAEKVARAMDLQQAHRAVFATRHEERLKGQLAPSPSNVLRARTPGNWRNRLLMIEDRVPHTFLGAGFPRSAHIVRELVAAGALVTFFPTMSQPEEWRDVRATVPPEVEVMLGRGIEKLEEFLEERRGFYAAILVSRPHNMKAFLEVTRRRPDLIEGSTLIYDAEAIFAAREILERGLRGDPPAQVVVEAMLDEEASLARTAHLVLSVSAGEAAEFRRLGVDNVEELGHALDPAPGQESFRSRRGFLFVGRLEDDGSPNVDGLSWFVRDILPLVQKSLDQGESLTVVGAHGAPSLSRLNSTAMTLLGQVKDLSPIYNASRVFIAPTRFAAGIPHKVHEAAAHGVPIIATPLLAEQLGWQRDEDLLVGRDAEEFAAQCVRLYQDEELWLRLRRNALHRIREDCNPLRFRQAIVRIVNRMREGAGTA